MADKIKIRAGEDQEMVAIHSKPEKSLATKNAKTLIVMIHGFPGNKAANNDIYGDLEFILTEKGFHTLRFDFRCCGESDGLEEDFTIAGACEDFQTMMFWARENGYRKFVFIGEGLGASIAIKNSDTDVNALMMLWPVLDFKEHFKTLSNNKKISASSQQLGYIAYGDNRIGLHLLHELKKMDLLYALKEIYEPTLIMHGARDTVVPIKQLDLARNCIKSPRIEITTFHDGEHGLEKLAHRKSMFYHIKQFVEKYA